MDRQSIARLLVVDDEPNVQYSLEKSLQSDWLQVVTASTAREGIDLVRHQHPDAVILDVRLPDMSGLDAFDEIRRIDSRLPVIILTAYGDHRDGHRGHEAGRLRVSAQAGRFSPAALAGGQGRRDSAICGTCRP